MRGEASSICSIKFNVGQRSAAKWVEWEKRSLSSLSSYIIYHRSHFTVLVMTNDYSGQTSGAARPACSGYDEKRHCARQIMWCMSTFLCIERSSGTNYHPMLKTVCVCFLQAEPKWTVKQEHYLARKLKLHRNLISIHVCSYLPSKRYMII
jgi:hypothetical protein